MTATKDKMLDFAVFFIHRLSESWQMPPWLVYEKLTSAGIIHDYIIPFYDVLHTLGTEYLVADITEFAQKRGVVL